MRYPASKSPDRILEAGEFAFRLLSTGARGSVLASFSQAIYLLVQGEELIWIGSEEMPMHRRGLKMANLPSGVTVGSAVIVEDDCLCINPWLRPSLDQAVIWRAPQVVKADALDLPAITQKLKRVFEVISHLPNPAGFGGFLPGLHALLDERTASRPVEQEAAIYSHARPIILEIARAFMDGNVDVGWGRLGALAGLGEGLTPSGDDFLGGLFFCFNQLKRCYPVFASIPDPAVFVESLRGKTNPISFTILQDLSLGHGVEPVHHLTKGMLTDQSVIDLLPQIGELVSIGHSTGWDVLTGVLVGMLVVPYQATFGFHKTLV